MTDPTIERDADLADLADLLTDLFPEYDIDAESDAILTELDSWECWYDKEVTL